MPMHSLKRDVAASGYAFVRQYLPEAEIVGVARELGEPLTPWEGRFVQDLVPRATSTPNTYSGIYGLDRFPFHTDLAHWRVPPRYLLLRCVTGYADVPTLLLDGENLIKHVTLDILTRAIFKPRRSRDGSLSLLRLCEPTEGGYRIRWDEIFLKPASKVAKEADERIREHLRNCDPLPVALVEPDDTLLIDNWRMLHARSPVRKGCEDRKIQRVYLGALN